MRWFKKIFWQFIGFLKTFEFERKINLTHITGIIAIVVAIFVFFTQRADLEFRIHTQKANQDEVNQRLQDEFEAIESQATKIQETEKKMMEQEAENKKMFNFEFCSDNGYFLSS